MEDSKTYFRTGLGLKRAVLPVLEGEYHSRAVDWLKENGYRASAGGLTIRLAEEFGVMGDLRDGLRALLTHGGTLAVATRGERGAVALSV